MDSAAIRERFFAFFEAREHQRVPSSSLVPDDPTLLLTNAGMNQFKPYFRGEQQPPYKRAMSAQKCVRAGGKHNDLEEVGRTTRHLTFFEMLGNFSFGDYYKEAACPWAWDLVTEGYGLDPDRLWVSVYTTDDEAYDIWTEGVGVRPERVVRLGGEDNFWSMGVAGPCGPCSEIFVDVGERGGAASAAGPADNENRYVEIWNLVFMENDCDAAIEPVGELPTKNIDTGAGLERTAMVLQNVSTVFDTDLLGSLVRTAGELTGRPYGTDERADVGLKILADHARSMTFLVADGITPANEERGYVLRRIMRRAVRHARLLGRDEPVLEPLAESCIDLMSDAYPELAQQRDIILKTAATEEERFGSALKQGLSVLEEGIGRVRSTGAATLPGDVAFLLHDTFGFPLDLTMEVASEQDLDVDVTTFEALMAEQRSRARAARRTVEAAPAGDLWRPLLEAGGPTDFLGYEHLGGEGTIVALTEGAAALEAASEGDAAIIVLDRTVFYAEGGGQVGDRGVISGPSGTAEVTDTRRMVPGLTGHMVTVTSGELRAGDVVTVAVDALARLAAQRAHTATHILHWVLRQRLGEHATQAGSLVEPGRLRFDFNHAGALPPAQVADISDEVQARVLADDSVRAYETSFDFARSIGAMAIFGEKYGDFVRVVEVGDYSKELCGGTHVPHTSQIGVTVVTGESSIGANQRRIEALVGREGIDWLQRRAAILERAAGTLKTTPEEVEARLEHLLATHRDMERRLAAIERSAAESDAAALAQSALDIDGSRLLVAQRDADVDALRSLAQMLKGRLGSAVVVLGARGAGRANLVGAVTKDLTARGISARDLLAPGASLLGGGAGGKPELAVSGGPSAERLGEAMQAVERAAREALGH